MNNLQKKLDYLQKDYKNYNQDLIKYIFDSIIRYQNTSLNISIKTLSSLINEILKNYNIDQNKQIDERKLLANCVARMNIHGLIKEPDDYQPTYPYRGMFYLNPFIGCNYGCIYCYRNDSNGNTKDWYLKGKPIQIMSAKESVDSMVNHPWFVKDVTNIGLHSSTTDPFIPAVKKSTFELLDEIEKKGLKNDVILITKYFIEENDIKKLEQYKNNIIIFLTYTANPPQVEPLGSIPAVKEKIWKTRNLLNESKKLRWGHYYRPITEGWNDSPTQIKEALEFGSLAEVSIIGGLKPIENIEELSKENNLPVPKGKFKGRTYKYLSQKIIDRIFEINKEYNNVIVNDQSCGITILKGRNNKLYPNIEGLKMYDNYYENSNKNSRIDNNIKRGCFKCSIKQMNICDQKDYTPKEDEIDSILKKVFGKQRKYKVNDDGLFIYVEKSENIPLHMKMAISTTLNYAVFLINQEEEVDSSF
ncbi:radical SAM protein [Mammaliicoccus sciuri]|uniref:radical SAM protein n=1 Tax=Mammaliicoccus sciuri TaxID=1296 RepID=UPI0037BBA17D